MAKNGISSLPTKQQRQEAKLNLAALKRATDPTRYSKLSPDLTSLPTRYSGNSVIDNVNSSGLKQGRPWV